MSKFIDADRLRAEIERRFWDYGTPLHDDEVTTKVNEVLSLIDSLQQEQPEVDLENEIGTYFQGWTNCDDYDQALNAEGECVCVEDAIDIARHFAKWQKEQDKETIELAEEHAYLAGAVNEREKMMKDAVAGRVFTDVSPKNLLVENDKWDALLGQFDNGQRVRVILVKEDEK